MRYKKYIQVLVPLFISFLCIYLVYKNIDFNLFFSELSETNYILILIASFLLCFTVFIRALRWKIILNKDISIYNLFKVQMIGYFANNILFFRIGEVLKSYTLGKKENISKSYILGTVVFERFLDMLILFLMILVCMIISPIMNIGDISLFKILLVVFGILGLFLIMFFSLSKVSVPFKFVEQFISNFVLAYQSLGLKQFIYSILLGIVIWIIYWVNVDLVFKAFGNKVEIHISLIILIVASLIVSVPSLPGGIGTFHLGVNLTLLSLGVINSESVLPFVTVLHGYGYIVLTLIGLYYFVIDKDLGISHLIEFDKIKN